MLKMKKFYFIFLMLMFAMGIGSLFIKVSANTALDSPSDAEINYLKMKNHVGPSGVALGALGGGYYEIDPSGLVSRTCVNNIHKDFINYPNGMVVAVRDQNNSSRLQRGGNQYNMPGYEDSYYTGLWPRVELEFQGGEGSNSLGTQSFNAYSGVVAQNIKNSSLSAVYYSVNLTNNTKEAKSMSAMISWADLIGRGLRDTNKKYENGKGGLNLAGDSNDWYFMDSPKTFAEGVTLKSGSTKYVGVKQYANDKIEPHKFTFQNYNNSFMILAEEAQGSNVSILKNFDVNSQSPFTEFQVDGSFSDDSSKVNLSNATVNANAPSNGSAVAVETTVEANSSKEVKFMVCWYMPEYSREEIEKTDNFQNCDYNKYYTTYAKSIEELATYAISERQSIYDGILEWQQPILNSNMPDWLKFKEINSGYTLYTNGVLNSKKNFSTLEGEMGGYGGTMDQKMSSHPFYEKLFPELNRNENRQFGNVTGQSGEIQHFDLHYYHGISDFREENKEFNPTPAGSMIDNSGAWMVQMFNDYLQTGDNQYIKKYQDVMNNSMSFIRGKCPVGTNIPNYNTTYDDFSHPEILIFSGTVYLNMLDIAEKWSKALNDNMNAEHYHRLHDATYQDVEKLYIRENEISGEKLSYYSFGSTASYIASNKEQGEIETNKMFSGAMAGQFMSRYSGLGDVIPFDQYVSHMQTFIKTSVQSANDYYSPKVYNMKTQQALDNAGSRCWPFYLDSYGAMAAIQAGYVEDGLEIMQHVQLVHLRNGWTWTQNLWNPGYSTYMTAPVVWFLNDVLAGSAIDVPNNMLTLGPTGIGSNDTSLGDKLDITVYYPKFWATIHYDQTKGELTYEIIKTFYEEGEAPITFNKVKAQPQGKATNSAKIIEIPEFKVVEGNKLDLGSHVEDFKGTVLEKNLLPVNKYVNNAQEKIADGTGLRVDYYDTLDYKNNSPVASGLETSLDDLYNKDNTPHEKLGQEYTLVYTGAIMPRYSQKYNLIFEHINGEIEVILDGKSYQKAGFIHKVESEQFAPWVYEGTELNVIEVELKAGQHHSIQIVYKHSGANENGGLRFQWWSTTQTLSVVMTERMYPPVLCTEWMSATNFSTSEGLVQVEGDHLGYVQNENWVKYTGIDFGSKGYQIGSLELMAACPLNSDCNGGTLEIYLDGLDTNKVGSVEIKPTGSWTNWKKFEGNFALAEEIKGLHDVYFKFLASKNFFGNVHSFRFGKSFGSSEYPTEITFEKEELTVNFSSQSYLNNITINEGGNKEAIKYYVTDLDGAYTDIATVDENGLVTFNSVGDVKVIAKSLKVVQSYILHIDEQESQAYASDFTKDTDGWLLGNTGKEYDRSDLVDGKIELEGSDLGTTDQDANSWMLRVFRLQANLDYSFEIVYNTPDAGAATMMRVIIICDGNTDVLQDWVLVQNTTLDQVISFDITEYAGKIFTLRIEQSDKGTGSGEILFIKGVTLIGTDLSDSKTFFVRGKTLAGASVEILNDKNEVLEVALAGKTGNFIFKDLLRGNYTLRITKEGYETALVTLELSDDTILKEIKLEEKTLEPTPDSEETTPTEEETTTPEVKPEKPHRKGCSGSIISTIIPLVLMLTLLGVLKIRDTKKKRIN